MALRGCCTGTGPSTVRTVPGDRDLRWEHPRQARGRGNVGSNGIQAVKHGADTAQSRCFLNICGTEVRRKNTNESTQIVYWD